jgi:hypothetical protein
VENTAQMFGRMVEIELELEYLNEDNLSAHEDETISTKLLIIEKGNLKNEWLSKTEKE